MSIHSEKYIGLMTYHTLRYLHRDKDIKHDFYNCNSPEEIKQVLWRRMEPLFKNGTKKVKSYSNVRIVPSSDVNTIHGKPKMTVEADEHAQVIGEEASKEMFLKGIKTCDFNIIYEWLVEEKKKKEATK
jgi:hypothetical protein